MLPGFIHSEGARTLVLVFHGIGTRLEPLAPLVETIRAELRSDGDIWMPPRWSGVFSNADAAGITRDAALEVDQLMDAYRFERIIVVGYSAGGIFARKFVVYANGEEANAPFEAEAKKGVGYPRAWASKIERVILLAGMNRGWEFAPTVNPFKLMLIRFAYMLLRIFPGITLMASLRRGAPFVADLRNQWLSLSRRGALENLLVVQILGTIDDVVSPEDNIDTETGSNFVYLDVPGSGHDNVRDFNDKRFGSRRREAFLAAFRDDRETLKARQVPPPPPEYPVDPSVHHVLFVIHGIRDYGFWTAHLARHVVAAAQQQGVSIMPLTPKYGYFAMLPFIIPSTRLAKIRWFMDQYTEALARFPNATRFSYIGHSNGTYLLAGALRDYRTCHFDRVLFAGSVVRSDFSWQDYIDAGRVRAVLNYVADADWVVAIFPRFLATLGADVGGAGWEGFTPKPPSSTEPVNDVKYVDGGHGAALREQHWNDIASFIIGQPVLLPPSGRHDFLIGFLARISPLVWLVLIGVILLPPFCWISPWPIPGLRWLVPDWSFGGRAFLSFLWLMLMRFILTRV